MTAPHDSSAGDPPTTGQPTLDHQPGPAFHGSSPLPAPGTDPGTTGYLPAAHAGGYPSAPVQYPAADAAPNSGPAQYDPAQYDPAQYHPAPYPPAQNHPAQFDPAVRSTPYGTGSYDPAAYSPPPYGQSPYAAAAYGSPYPAARAPRNGLGTASLVLGIISVVTSWTVYLGVLLGILAIIFGSVGLARAKRGEATNRGSALAGLVLGIIAIGLLVLLVVVGISLFATAISTTR